MKKSSMMVDTKIPNYPKKVGEFASYTPRTPSPTGKAKATKSKRLRKRMAY